MPNKRVAAAAAISPPFLGRIRPPATIGKKKTELKIELEEPEKKTSRAAKQVSMSVWIKPNWRRLPLINQQEKAETIVVR